VGSLTTSPVRAVATATFWSSPARTETAPSGATGESSTGSNAGSATAYANRSNAASARGSTGPGAVKRLLA
jgi:hypothetical protein